MSDCWDSGDDNREPVNEPQRQSYDNLRGHRGSRARNDFQNRNQNRESKPSYGDRQSGNGDRQSGYDNRQSSNGDRQSGYQGRDSGSGRKDETSAILEIDPSKVGMVIGRGGSKIRETQETFKVYIKVG